MLQEAISAETKDDLEILTRAGILKDYYLAGGTGLRMIKTVSWDEVKRFFIKEFGNIKL